MTISAKEDLSFLVCIDCAQVRSPETSQVCKMVMGPAVVHSIRTWRTSPTGG